MIAGHLGDGQTVVERNEERAEPGEGEVALHHLDPVLGEDGDPVTAPDSEGGQAPGEFDRAVVELGPGDATALVDEGGAVGVALAVALRQLGQPHQAPPAVPAAGAVVRSATNRS